MASPTFGLPGNGAPPPPVFMGTNPTGGTRSAGTEGSAFPSFGLFGNPNTNGAVSPTANMPVFSGTSGGLADMSSAFGDMGTKTDNALWKQLTSTYGKGTGDILYNIFIRNGLFNPQVSAAFLNAMQPGIQRGQGDILNSFGAEGSRFGSAASLGLGDYMSQVNLNEQQTLASMYEQAQQEQLAMLTGILPTIHAEQANKGGLLGDILGGLEAVGGIAAAPFTGGASLSLTGAGIGTIVGANSGGGGGGGGFSGGNPFMSLQGLFNKGGSASNNPMEIPWNQVPDINMQPFGNFWDTYSTDALSGSGADAILAG